MSAHNRIPVSRPSGHHMSCSCGWTSEGCETPALAFRAYLAHIDSHATAVAGSIIAATPAGHLPRKTEHGAARNVDSGGAPTQGDATSYAARTE